MRLTKEKDLINALDFFEKFRNDAKERNPQIIPVMEITQKISDVLREGLKTDFDPHLEGNMRDTIVILSTFIASSGSSYDLSDFADLCARFSLERATKAKKEIVAGLLKKNGLFKDSPIKKGSSTKPAAV